MGSGFAFQIERQDETTVTIRKVRESMSRGVYKGLKVSKKSREGEEKRKWSTKRKKKKNTVIV